MGEKPQVRAGTSRLDLRKAFTLIEPGPVMLVTTFDGKKNNIMTIPWTMVVDVVEKHDIVVLEGLAAWLDRSREEKRTIHATGDGTFVADGTRFDRRKLMRTNLPAGV